MAEQHDANIQDEKDYQHTLAALAEQSRPPSVLRFLMNRLEAYRGARKMGWSRPWNKYGVMNVQSFKLDFSQDAELLNLARSVLEDHFPSIPTIASRFVDQLLDEREQLMGFIFVQEYFKDGQAFEGVNLSLGRRTEGQPRYRDRFDLILESPVENGESQGLSRLRVYIDPYLATQEPLWSASYEMMIHASARTLFERLADVSWTWSTDSSRIWSHWTAAYIDYFGPRQLFMRNSYFYLPDHPEGRLQPDSVPPIPVARSRSDSAVSAIA